MTFLTWLAIICLMPILIDAYFVWIKKERNQFINKLSNWGWWIAIVLLLLNGIIERYA